VPGGSIEVYRARRDFGSTPEPHPTADSPHHDTPRFVVQKHQAARAGLHWDFRLEHDGVLWSWAVPKGPSMDPADRRMAIHVEDHPIDYATFSGEIPAGGYGAGSVEIWDSGTWRALDDPEFGMGKGHLHFELRGQRLRGLFSLIRMRQRGRSEAWLLIKGQDLAASEGADASALEAAPLAPGTSSTPPVVGASAAVLPRAQKPQLCVTLEDPPDGPTWVSEVKFDGYRLLARIEAGVVRLMTRNGHDWTERMPHLARALAGLNVQAAMIDGELVALDSDGVPSFADLQAALSAGRDKALVYYAFDLLHLDGWDLRQATLLDRKTLLRALGPWDGALRYSDHQAGRSAAFLALVAKRGLEGIVVKRADAPYRAGRGPAWAKIKCLGREEFVVLGWTPPAGRRIGLGALQVGHYDKKGGLHYAGGVGTGFTDTTLADLRRRLDSLAAPAPPDLIVDGEPVDRAVRWVRPELVAEIEFAAWSGGGRLRHAVFLGLRDDKAAADVVQARPAMTQEKTVTQPKQPARKSRIVVAAAPRQEATMVAGVALSHATRALWPGITKLDLAQYWQSVADAALGGIARRPLAILRCPDGIAGEQFFQKNRGGFLPEQIRDGMAMKQPFLAIDDVTGLVALAQMSAIELHCWGAAEDDPQHPDRLVFDLDPGEGVDWGEVIQAAHDLKDRLARLRLASFCRTSGGKGLHLVVPVGGTAEWPAVKSFCRAFAETMSAEEPKRFLAHTRIADRRGRILIDWLRNGPGATAIASFSPRARPGAAVATTLAWREVTARLDPQAFTVLTIPARLRRLRRDPWEGFDGLRQNLQALPEPALSGSEAPAPQVKPRAGGSRIVVAKRPRRVG
jgi:bifunctional non-homologous end joining protein LigD